MKSRKEKGVYHGTFHVPIYGWNVFVFSGDQSEETLKTASLPIWMRDRMLKNGLEAGLMMSETESQTICLWFGSKKQRRARKIIEAVTHEVFHATYAILDFSQIELTEETEEVFAYLNGYLNNAVFTIMRGEKP